MRFETEEKVMVYMADTYYDERLIPICEDADLLITGASYYADMDAKKFYHMNTLEIGKLATEANVRRLVLTRLPHVGNREKLVDEVSEVYKKEIILAKMGRTIDV
jgi:ribonuclease BN (tRNA processing enzyme)